MGLNDCTNDANSDDAPFESILEKALDVSEKLRDALTYKHSESDVATYSTTLNEMTTALGLADWHIDANKLSDPMELVKHLASFEKLMANELSSSATHGDALTREQLIAQASGGAALYGVGLGIVTSADRTGILQRPENPLLAQPTSCAFMGPTSAVTTSVEQFSTVQAATDFRQTMKTCGRSMGLALKASYAGVGGGVGGGKATTDTTTATTADTTTTTSAAQVTYAYVPMQSFRMTVQDMQLSDEAKAVAATITNEMAATYFLQDFGSHAVCGVHEVGGIFCKTVEITTKDRTAVDVMQAECAKRSSSHLSVGYSVMGFGMSVAVDGGRFTAATDTSGHHTSDIECEITTRLDHFGPDASSLEIFKKKLATTNHAWYLIDRPMATSVVGVWDLMAKVDGCQQPAELVRHVWLKQAHKFRDLPVVHAAMQRARIQTWLCSPMVDSVLKHAVVDNPDQAELAARRLVDATCALDLSIAPADDVRNAVVQLFSALVRYDSEFSLHLTVQHLRSATVQGFLRRLAASDRTMADLTCLCPLFDNIIDDKILHATPAFELEPSFRAALERARVLVDATTHDDVWVPPIVSDVGQVPDALENLVMPFLDQAQPDMQLLASRVGAFLVRNVNTAASPSTAHDDLWEVAKRYGFEADGGFMGAVNAENITYLIHALRYALTEHAAEPADDDDDGMAPSSVFEPPAASSSGTTPDVPDGRSYKHLLTVAGRPDRATCITDLLWYTIKHRLDFEEELYPPRSAASGKKKPLKKGEVRAPAAAPAESPVILDALLELAQSLSVTARAEVFRLLLERRVLVPFLVATSDHPTTFRCEAAALEYVDTLISSATEGTTSTACLMRDVAALRVVVVSDRDAMSSVTKDWIKNVFHIQSVHALDRVCSNRVTQRPCVAELGWGFVKQGSKFETVMVLHVIGEYHRLDTFIEAFADAIVIDVGQDGGSNVPMRRGCVLKWQHSNEDEDDEDVSEDGSVVTTIEMRCPISSSYASIQEYLFMYGMPEKGAAGRVPVPEIAAASTALVPTRPAAVSAAAVCLATDFASFRTHTLKLQRIFVEEAKLMIMYHRETNVANKEMHLEKARQLRQHNTQISRVVQDHPLIAHFIEALKHQSPVARERAIIDLELHLAASSERASETARHEYRRARDAVNRAKTRATQQAYVDALETWGLMVTGLEHLWRELSHMFVGSPREYGHFPELAAMHLLDGFPMELMDGDAAMVNLKWITAILNKLEDKLPTARIFVLSIMGVQSAGKSTLLNYMFGVRLRTSVSRCTRGVSLQLLQCDGRAEYDYILLLDTEGIRSPEYIGTEGSVWRDNRMATLAILPSDATIILTKGESTVTISEILPIVLSVFLDSELTEKHRGQLASKFYFVFNQIDTSQSTNMETIVDTLLRNLRSNAKKIQAIRGNPMATSDDEEESSIKYFSQFQVDIKDEDASDVRFLGTIKGSSEPPDDAPTPQYGKRLLKFRDYIHDRASHYVGATGQLVKNRPWTGRLVREFNDDLTRVWECINQSNFQMDFLAAHERVSYDELIRIMTQHKQHLARAYSEAFDTVLQHICDDNANNVRVDEHSRKYEHKLKQEVQPAVFRLDTLACADLDADKFAKWKLDQEIKWQNHKINQEAHTLRLVKDKVNQVFLYDIHVKKYKEMLYDEITTKFRDAGNRGATKTKFHLTDKAFEDLFERLMYKAKADHPPVAPTVCPAIYELFVHGGLFNPKQLSFLHQQRRRGPTARVDVVRMRRANDTILLQSTEATQLEVQEYVRSLLVDTQRYSQDVATDCILQTKEFLAKLRLPNTTYDACVPVLYTTLVSQFKAIQEKWDEENSVSAKFATCKPVMKKFAQHLCSGHKAADLLIATLDDWIANHLSKAVAEEVVSSVASTLKHEPWVSDARSMQAYLDHSLLCEMKAKRIDNVLRWLQSPTDHSALVIQGLIQAKVKECFGTAADTIVTTMKTCVTTAATDAATFDRDRSKRFIVALRHSLQKALKGSGRSVLVENLPNADDDVMNCDHHGPTIFTTSKDVNVLTSTMQSLERHKAALRPSNYTTAELADGILKMIRTEAYGASSGVVPRCGMPCPRCFCPCTKALGHKLSDDPNEALHDTYHQPKGIIGSYKVETGQLVAGTCPAAVEKDVYMVLEGGDRSFREFDKVYPGWAIPTKQEPLPLREYIFATYQAQLAEMHNKAKCVRIPREYYHDLDDITRKIQRLLHKN